MKKILIMMMAVSVVAGATYNKANKVRECEITKVYDEYDLMVIEHPNGHLYSMTYNPNEIYVVEGDTIEVVFDELHEWDTQYEIKEVR